MHRSLIALTLATLVSLVTPVHAQTQHVYVDPAAGNNTNPGTTSRPYQTLQHALNNAVPGTTINLATGTYHEENTTVRPGTATQPITIKPAPGAQPVLDGRGKHDALRITHPYYHISNLEIANTKEGVRIENTHHVTLQNNHLHHIDNECLRLRYNAHHHTISHNRIHDCGRDGNGEGIYLGTAPEQRHKNHNQPDATTNNIISHNEVHNVTEGIDLKEDSAANTIEFNVTHHTTDPNSAGINIRSDNNTLRHNLSYHNAGAGFRFGGDTAPHPTHGPDYHYGINNVLHHNHALFNTYAGYKYMRHPQNTDCTNIGLPGQRGLHYYDDHNHPSLNCTSPLPR